ncbi:MAG TPA: cupin domain-containing protein, partial [Sediminibacterium sp.]|nr:cupin domain-containing protein [Sediminibacterium sp.]
MQQLSIPQAFDQVQGYWNPLIVAELNGQQIKLVKFQGPFTWHHHVAEDEAFWVFKGSFQMEFRDKTVWLKEGDLLVVPKGVEHRPNAPEEVWVVLFEPAGTLNTGNVQNEFTVDAPEKL